MLKFDSPTKAATTNIGMIFDVHGGQTGTLQYNELYGFGILGGNVGIGTSEPSTRLTVNDGSGAYSPSGLSPVGIFMTGTKNKPAYRLFRQILLVRQRLTQTTLPCMLMEQIMQVSLVQVKHISQTTSGSELQRQAFRYWWKDQEAPQLLLAMERLSIAMR